MKKSYDTPELEIEKFTIWCEDFISGEDPGQNPGEDEDDF